MTGFPTPMGSHRVPKGALNEGMGGMVGLEARKGAKRCVEWGHEGAWGGMVALGARKGPNGAVNGGRRCYHLPIRRQWWGDMPILIVEHQRGVQRGVSNENVESRLVLCRLGEPICAVNIPAHDSDVPGADGAGGKGAGRRR